MDITNDIYRTGINENFQTVVDDTEALLNATADLSGEKLMEIRAKLEESLAVAKEKMADAQAAVIAKSKAMAHAADVYVQENPWKALSAGVGGSLAIGFLAGLLVGRR